jgi:predicted nucleic acid-binding protein
VKILPDSNVWVSGFATRGLCADLLRLALRRHGLGDFELLTCAAVRAETLRILRDKFKANEADLALVRTAMAAARDVAEGDWTPPPGFPDPDDAPIVGAAIAAAATLLVTGDRRLLELQEVGGVAVVAPRAAYEHLLDPG